MADRIRRGEVVEPMIASANRDEAVFEDAEHIDIERASNPHLGFGGGVHRCVGSTLARMEGQVVFREVARRFPHLTLDDSVEPAYMDRQRGPRLLVDVRHPRLRAQ